MGLSIICPVTHSGTSTGWCKVWAVVGSWEDWKKNLPLFQEVIRKVKTSQQTKTIKQKTFSVGQEACPQLPLYSTMLSKTYPQWNTSQIPQSRKTKVYPKPFKMPGQFPSLKCNTPWKHASGREILSWLPASEEPSVTMGKVRQCIFHGDRSVTSQLMCFSGSGSRERVRGQGLGCSRGATPSLNNARFNPYQGACISSGSTMC